MKITLPSSKTKHYLTGMDWIIHALDEASRKQLGSGTPFQIVIELTSTLEEQKFEEAFAMFCAYFPHLNGAVCRDWNLAPYWKSRPSKIRFKLKTLSATSVQQAYQCLESEINQPGLRDDFSLRAAYVEIADKAILGIIFDHRLFDARGAEKFLQAFQTFYTGQVALTDMSLSPGPAHLDRWAEKFAAGKKVNRNRIAQAKNAPAQQIKPKGLGQGCLNRFLIKTFDTSQTRAILDRAGVFMFLPYSLAVSLRAMKSFFSQKSSAAGDLVVSVTCDMRPSYGQALSQSFFNQLSFMFFKVAPRDVDDFARLLASLKNQFYEQIKNKMPEALAEASMLMRILPLPILSFALRSQKVAAASFSFASLGESAYESGVFMDAKVERLFHMPRMPPLPGLGIFFSQYQGKLSVTLSFLEPLLQDGAAEQILSALDL